MCEEAYLYVDVRTVEEFAAGHPAGAYNVPISLPGPGGMRANSDFVSVMAAAFGRDQPLVVGCKSGSRSMRAASALIEAGFQRVVDQRAGYGGVRDAFGRVTEPGWEAARLPCTTRAEPEREYAALQLRSG
jgi:rhodanese-related sulfurtransferase